MITSSRLDYFELFPLNCSFYIHWNYSLAIGWCRCLITCNELVYSQKFILYMNNAVNLRSLVNYVRLQNLTNLNKQIFSELVISGERELVISCDETACINSMYFFCDTLDGWAQKVQAPCYIALWFLDLKQVIKLKILVLQNIEDFPNLKGFNLMSIQELSV